MSLRFVYILLVLRASEICSSENAQTPSYDLCNIGPALTSLNGSIYSTFGTDCSRLILAPKGYRIELNITKNTRILEAKPMYIVDGATRFHKLDTVKISRHRVLDNHIAISTSNAILIQVDKITSANTNVEIIYKMFKQPRERCLCLPVSHGDTVCSFTSLFARDDSLTKECTVACGQRRFIANRFFFHDFKIRCFMGDPEHDLYNKGKWNAIGQFEILHDDQLITCAKIYPATRIKLGYKFTYTNVTCGQVNETVFEKKVREYISSIQSVANVSQCFKSLKPEDNANCRVEHVNITCQPRGRSAEVLLVVRDNIINSTNETIAYQQYFQLYAPYKTDIVNKQNLVKFITKNLTINGTKPVGISYVFPKRPSEDCPRNAAPKIDYANSNYGCLNCPPNFYHQETAVIPCHECQNGTRRRMNESSCIAGARSYPEPSQKYCKHTCNLGKFFNINSSLCEWCPYGAYQNSTTMLNPQCTPCPNGLTTGFVGARNVSECINFCPAGSYLEYTQCLQCNVGYFMPNASHRLPACYKCPSGYTTLGVGTIETCVKRCTVGEYFNTTLQNCTLCPNNTYQDETNDTNTRICKKCPQNTTTAAVGSTMLSECLGPCRSGQYINIVLQTCSPCSRNTYQDAKQHVNFNCKSCGEYKITLKTGSTNFSECIYTCSEGSFFNATSKVCEDCPINTFQDELGKDACKPCQGKTSTVKTASVKCISPCGVGEFLNKSAEKCLKCSEGFYQNISEYTSHICHPCPTDFYSDKPGQSNCTRCKSGSITFITGASSEDECVETCQPGYYLNKTAKSCQKCVKGFYQDKTGFKEEFCTKCKSANLTTLRNGAKSEEECVGYCASFPCRNGGVCANIENDFSCTCPKFLAGKQCETIVDRNNSDTMEISIRFPDLTWTENIESPESDEFKTLASRIESSIRTEFENDNIFRTVKVVGFRKGSVISDVQFVYVGGVNFVTPVDKLSALVSGGRLGNLTVDPKSVTVTNYTCSQPLGMENRRIPDSAITSGVSRFYHPPKNARLHNQGPGWAPQYFSAEEDYLQVDFLEDVWLTGIATQGSSYYSGSWLRAFYIQSSSDAQDWSDFAGESVIRHVFIANDDIDTVVRNSLPYPIKTRYVRMFEYDIEKWISFRVEFYGCPIPKTVPLPTMAPLPSRSPSVATQSPSVPSQSPSVPSQSPSVATQSPSVATQKTSPTQGTTSITLGDDNDDTNVGLIVGVTLGVFAVCLIVVLLLVWWWMKRNRGSHVIGYSPDIMQLKETK